LQDPPFGKGGQGGFKIYNSLSMPVTSLFQRLKQGLSRTRQQLFGGLSDLLRGKKQIDAELLEELETHLLAADVGTATTQKIMENLAAGTKRAELNDSEQLLQGLRRQLIQILTPHEQPLIIDTNKKPFVILMVGINGAGKTTTLGKLAKHWQEEGKSVMLAAGDTFRAAAVEQLQAWGERNKVSVIAQQAGADPAAVIFDAMSAARARNIDVLLADTAGRLHTQDNLMAELQKVVRVIKKADPSAPHEILLVLDGGIGQNALQQVKQFDAAIGLTGLAITKLDGTAKGGVLFALAAQNKLPIRFVGVGEAIDDLQVFKAEDFVSAMFDAN